MVEEGGDSLDVEMCGKMTTIFLNMIVQIYFLKLDVTKSLPQTYLEGLV